MFNYGKSPRLVAKWFSSEFIPIQVSQNPRKSSNQLWVWFLYNMSITSNIHPTTAKLQQLTHHIKRSTKPSDSFMAPSKFLFPIQQKGQTTSLITSTMTFFLAIGRKISARPAQLQRLLAAQKNLSNKGWRFGQVTDPWKREVYLCWLPNLYGFWSIPLANFINSATQSTSHQRFSKKKISKHAHFSPYKPIFPTFLPGTKRLIQRPLPYQRFSTSLFRCRIADFLRTEPTP